MNQDTLYDNFTNSLINLINESGLCASAVLLILKQVEQMVYEEKQKNLKKSLQQ